MIWYWRSDRADVTEDNSSEEGGVTVIEVTKPNMAQKGIIKVSKTGEVFSSVAESDGIYQPVYEVQGLPGAVFEITALEDVYTLDGTLRYSAGEVVDTITTGEDGTAQSQPLYLGKFQVKETQFPHGMVDTGENVTNVELVYAGQEVEVTEKMCIRDRCCSLWWMGAQTLPDRQRIHCGRVTGAC